MALEVLAAIYRVFGFVCLFIAVLAIVGWVGSAGSAGGEGEILSRLPTVIGGVTALVGAAFTCFLAAELIAVVLSIESNTRETRDAVLALHREQRTQNLVSRELVTQA